MFPLLALLAVGFVVYKVSQSSGTSSEPINRQTPNGAGNRQPGEGPQYGPDYQPGTADDQYTGPGSQSESFQDLTGAFWTITRVNGLNNVYLWNGQTTSYGGKNFTQASRSLLISEIQKLAAEVYGPDHMPGTADDQYTGPGTQSESFPDRAGALWTITRLAGVNYGVPGYFWNGQTTSYGGKTLSKTTRELLISEIQKIAAEGDGSSDSGGGGIDGKFTIPKPAKPSTPGSKPAFTLSPSLSGGFSRFGSGSTHVPTLLERVNIALAEASLPQDLSDMIGPILRSYATWKAPWSVFPRDPEGVRGLAAGIAPYAKSSNVAFFLNDLAAKIEKGNAEAEAAEAERVAREAADAADAATRERWPGLTSPPVSTDPVFGPVLFDIARGVRLQEYEDSNTSVLPMPGYPAPDTYLLDMIASILQNWTDTYRNFPAARAELETIYTLLNQMKATAELPEVSGSGGGDHKVKVDFSAGWDVGMIG